MDKRDISLLMLFVLLVPVSCEADSFFTEPIACYILDGILIIYCIIATGFYFREKFPHTPCVATEASEGNGAIYQELDRSKDADPYQVLEPTKRKKKAAKKKKPQPTRDEEKDKDPYESLGTPAPPLSPRFPA